MMEQHDIQKIIDGLRSSIELHVKEAVYEQSMLKDKEVSSLHREIKDKLNKLDNKFDGVKLKLDEHDLVIKEIMSIYTASGWIKKGIMWFILFVPSAAAFFVGSKYLYHLFKGQ